MFIIDEGRVFDLQHPIHIHGYSPYIIATERHAKEPESFFPIGRTAILRTFITCDINYLVLFSLNSTILIFL